MIKFRLLTVNYSMHWSWFLMWVCSMYAFRNNEFIHVNDVALIAFFPILSICIVLHELGHLYYARRAGIECNDVMLMALGGVASLKEEPQNPYDDLKISFGGPLVTLVIFVFLVEVALISNNNYIDVLAVFNLVILIFNMLPVVPLDGGRILRASLTIFMTSKMRADYISYTISQCVSLVVIPFFYMAGMYMAMIIMLLAFAFCTLSKKEASDEHD